MLSREIKLNRVEERNKEKDLEVLKNRDTSTGTFLKEDRASQDKLPAIFLKRYEDFCTLLRRIKWFFQSELKL